MVPQPKDTTTFAQLGEAGMLLRNNQTGRMAGVIQSAMK